MSWAGSVSSQRLEFVQLVLAGVSMTEACRRFGISRPTGYKWLERFTAEGLAGLEDRSRRPFSSPGQTDPGMEELVCEVRGRFPAWGGRKIRAFLIRQGHQQVPAASTITQILRRRGLINPPTPAVTADGSFEAAAPNLMWQIDFKGHFGMTDGGRCHPLGVLDDHSRFNLGLVACPNQTTVTVQAVLQQVFTHYGRPDTILADNGPPWGSPNARYRWTPLKVWLADLDIRVIHSTPRHPQTLGKEERFHLTLDTELLIPGRPWPNLTHVQDAFNQWRPIYNHQRPHQALNDQVPADRYQPSPRSYPTTIEPVVYPDHWDTRTVDTAARISYHGTSHKIGKPFIGKTIAINPATYIAYYRTHPIRHVNHVPDQT